MAIQEHFRSAAAGVFAAAVPGVLFIAAGAACLGAGVSTTTTLIVLAAVTGGGIGVTQDVARSAFWNTRKTTFALAALGTMASIVYGAYEAQEAFTDRFIKSDDIENVEKGALRAPIAPELSV